MDQNEEFTSEEQLLTQGRIRTKQQFKADVIEKFGEDAANDGIQVVIDYFS